MRFFCTKKKEKSKFLFLINNFIVLLQKIDVYHCQIVHRRNVTASLLISRSHPIQSEGSREAGWGHEGWRRERRGVWPGTEEPMCHQLPRGGRPPSLWTQALHLSPSNGGRRHVSVSSAQQQVGGHSDTPVVNLMNSPYVG